MRRRVPSEPFAAIIEEKASHLEALGHENPLARIALLTGVSEKLIQKILSGERKEIYSRSADRIVTRLLGPMAWYTDEKLNEIYSLEEKRARPERVPNHGSRNEYTTHKCRCAPCTEANRLYIQDYKKRVAMEAA